jgi:hypothetical protein
MFIPWKTKVDKVLTDIGHLRLHTSGAKQGEDEKTSGENSHNNVQTFLGKETMHPLKSGCIASC